MKYVYYILLTISIAYGETREKVLIVDTGISAKYVDKKYLCKDGEKSMFKTMEDVHGHGSNVYGLIAENINSEKYCIVSLRIFGDDNKCSDDFCMGGLQEALKLIREDKNIKHLNLSLTGKSESLDELMIEEVLKRGGYVTVAAGNQGEWLDAKCEYYPACYKLKIKNPNFRVVGNSGAISSNFGKIVTDIEKAARVGNPSMTGTSQASAMLMGKLLKK